MESEGPRGPGDNGEVTGGALALVGTAAEPRFDQFTQLARRLLFAPMATFELIDDERVYCKSHPGLELDEQARLGSFCDEVVEIGGPLVVEDTAADERFSGCAVVAGEPQARFYAGVPVRDPSGRPIGALAAMDTVTRRLSPLELDVLVDLALMIETEVAAAPVTSTDAVTGLFDKRTFERIGDWLLEFTTRRGAHSLVLCAEVEGLVTAPGDDEAETNRTALSAAAGVLRSSVRGSDVVGRIGPVQMGVLLVNAKAESFPIVAERIAQAMEREPSAGRGCSFAFGVAEHDPESREKMADLVDRALAQLLDNAREAAATAAGAAPDRRGTPPAG